MGWGPCVSQIGAVEKGVDIIGNSVRGEWGGVFYTCMCSMCVGGDF